MRSNLQANYSVNGKYATNLLTSAAIDVIDSHTNESPLFLMLNHLAPHAGNEDNPFQAPEEEILKFAYIKDIKRRTLAGNSKPFKHLNAVSKYKHIFLKL